jgi:N-acetylneuraminic acid mutarotase
MRRIALSLAAVGVLVALAVRRNETDSARPALVRTASAAPQESLASVGIVRRDVALPTARPAEVARARETLATLHKLHPRKHQATGLSAATLDGVDGVAAGTSLAQFYPDAYDQPMRIGGRHATLDIAPAAGRGGGTAVDGALVYPDVAPGVDAIRLPEPDRTEEFLVAHGPAEIAYRVEPAGIESVREIAGHFEFRDAQGVPRVRLEPVWAVDAKRNRVDTRLAIDGLGHAARQPDGSIVYDVAGALTLRIELASACAYPVLVDPAWSTTQTIVPFVWGQTATRLMDGRVLVVGGLGFGTGGMIETCEVYDPATDTWSITGSLAQLRAFHYAALLPDGRVLAVGGYDNATTLAVSSCEIYDPATGAWSPTGSIAQTRVYGAAATLSSGQVLLAGGYTWDPATYETTSVLSCELYTPATGAWASTGALAVPRSGFTMTALADGKVLVAGGGNETATAESPFLSSCELYDPATGAWSGAAPLLAGRSNHAATVLLDGKVLVTGGEYAGACEIYDPAADTWSPTGSLETERQYHTATRLLDGKVLVTAGDGYYTFGGIGGPTVKSCELYDPASGAWSAAPDLPVEIQEHSALLLPTGKVLVVGGYNWDPTLEFFQMGQLLTPGSAPAFTSYANVQRIGRVTATLLPAGDVLVTGGLPGDFGIALTACERYAPATDAWSTTGSMSLGREWHTATLLGSGEVLVAGGGGDFWSEYVPASATASSELYSPSSGTWSSAPPMSAPRAMHTATLLQNGKVLVTGGRPGPLNSCELYDPATGAWSATGSMTYARAGHTATLLPNGKVLVTGGWSSIVDWAIPYCELYDPATGTWTPTGGFSGDSFGGARVYHTATLMPDGTVFVAGGRSIDWYWGDETSMCEIYNPATGTWSSGPWMPNPHAMHTATLLPDGQLVIVGGTGVTFTGGWIAHQVDTLAPGAGWTSTTLEIGRGLHAAVLLPSGTLFLAGGWLPTLDRTWRGMIYDPFDGEVPVIDVAVSALAAPPSALPGDYVAISATVTNEGSIASGLIPVNFTVGGTTVYTEYVPSLAAGASVVVTGYWDTTGFVGGSYAISAAIAPLPGETDTADNSVSGSITLAGAVVDVAVASASAPPSAPAGSSVTLSATVMNEGTAPASFGVDFSVGGSTVGSAAVAGLAPGASTTVSITWSAGVPIGGYPVVASVAPLAGETDTADNSASDFIWITATPSATLQGKQAWPEHKFYSLSGDEDAYQTLFGKVKNDGTAPATVRVKFIVTKDGAPYGTFYSGPTTLIAGGATAILTYNLAAATAGTGEYSVSAQAQVSLAGTWTDDGVVKTFTFDIDP